MVSIEVSTAERGDHAVVGLHGELDLSDSAGITAALAGVMAGHLEIIVDLTGLDFIDCSGLWVLSRAQEQATRAGGGLLLAAPQQLVLRVLHLTGLVDVLSVYASVPQAELAYARRRPV